MPPPTQAAAGYAVEKGQRKTNASEGAKMKQHITQDAAMALFHEVTKAGKGFATTQELMTAAIQHYIDQRAKELPVLPDAKHAKEWQHDMYTADQLQAYGQQCAEHAREVALSEAARVAAATVCDTHIPTGVQIYGSRAGKAIEALKGK